MFKKLFLLKQKGYILAFVLFIFLLITISITVLFRVSSNNTRELLLHENLNKAYYYSMNGMEIAMAALNQKDALDKTLLEDVKTKPSAANQTGKVYFTVDGAISNTETKYYSDLTIKKVSFDSKIWAEVTSIGYMTDQQNKTYKKRLIARVNVDRPAEIVWIEQK